MKFRNIKPFDLSFLDEDDKLMTFSQEAVDEYIEKHIDKVSKILKGDY